MLSILLADIPHIKRTDAGFIARLLAGPGSRRSNSLPYTTTAVNHFRVHSFDASSAADSRQPLANDVSQCLPVQCSDPHIDGLLRCLRKLVFFNAIDKLYWE
jgi:hypothetical protein